MLLCMMLNTPFWQRAAQSLPPHVRERYAAELERAERIDVLIGRLVDGWRWAIDALAQRHGRIALRRRT